MQLHGVPVQAVESLILHPRCAGCGECLVCGDGDPHRCPASLSAAELERLEQLHDGPSPRSRAQ